MNECVSSCPSLTSLIYPFPPLSLPVWFPITDFTSMGVRRIRYCNHKRECHEMLKKFNFKLIQISSWHQNETFSRAMRSSPCMLTVLFLSQCGLSSSAWLPFRLQVQKHTFTSCNAHFLFIYLFSCFDFSFCENTVWVVPSAPCISDQWFKLSKSDPMVKINKCWF